LKYSAIADRSIRNFPVIAIFIFIFIISVASCSSAQTAASARKAVQLKVPDHYDTGTAKTAIFSIDETNIRLWSRNFAQGDCVYVEIEPGPNESKDYEKITLSFGGQSVPLTKKKWGYRGFFAIPPESAVGITNAVLHCYIDDTVIEQIIPVTVADAKFKIFKEPLDLGSFSNKGTKLSPETLAFIEACTKKKNLAFAEIIPDLLNASLSHPRSMHYITSEFYSKRVYLRYKKQGKKNIRLKDAVSAHNGLDLRGDEGAPIFTIATGKVVYAEPAYYEGNLVIVNHGEGIFSYYMHMSKILAQQGTVVQAGAQIGEVGATGMVTGPHLHVSLSVHGIQADPLSILCLPIRD
jgi:murein DD-endopeptidase